MLSTAWRMRVLAVLVALFASASASAFAQEMVDVSLDLDAASLVEGPNLIYTAPDGTQLWADVHWRVTDANGNDLLVEVQVEAEVREEEEGLEQGEHGSGERELAGEVLAESGGPGGPDGGTLACCQVRLVVPTTGLVMCATPCD